MLKLCSNRVMDILFDSIYEYDFYYKIRTVLMYEKVCICFVQNTSSLIIEGARLYTIRSEQKSIDLIYLGSAEHNKSLSIKVKLRLCSQFNLV